MKASPLPPAPFSDWWTDDWQDRWDSGVVGVPECWIVSFWGTQICHLGSLGTPFLHPGDIFVRCWAPHRTQWGPH